MDGPAQERENRGKRIQFDRQQQHREWMLRRYTHLPGIAQKSIFVNHYTFTSVIPSCSFTFARVIPTHLIFLLILFGLLQVYWTCLQTYCVRVCEIMLYNYFCLFSLAANHKKRLLHRWLEIHHEEGGRQDECEMETEPPKEVVAQDEEPERPSSSLFEDFSDDDFDEREENGTSKEGVKMDTDSAVEREKLEEKEIDTVTVTPPTSPPIVATKPVSSQIQPSPVADNSPPTPPLQFSPAIESYTQETAPEKTDVKNDETEMDVSLPQPSTKILVVTETISPQPVNLSDSLLSSVSDDASSDKLQPEMLDSLSRPAGKRKMSLLEYRSRGKRPGAPEGKKTVLPPISIDRPSVSSPSSTSTTSLLSPSVSLLSFSSSFLSGSSRLASQPSTPHLPHPLTSTGG